MAYENKNVTITFTDKEYEILKAHCEKNDTKVEDFIKSYISIAIGMFSRMDNSIEVNENS
jgi:hypothetical protein